MRGDKILRQRTSCDRSRNASLPIPGALIAEDTPCSGDHFRPIRRASSAPEPPAIFQRRSGPAESRRGDTGNQPRRETRNTIVSSRIR